MEGVRFGRRRVLPVRRLRRGTAVLVGTAAALALAVGAAGSSGKATAGGVAYFAEPPQATPNYIFPFMSLSFFSVDNIPQFQQLMYRPLYWFGNGSNPTLNPGLSLASNPKYSKNNAEVTFTIKPYKWSNGETVDAQQVVFWMNMTKVEYLNWAAYVPGGMPDDLVSVTAPNPKTVVFKLKGQTNPYWFTYNELSQITPLPMAWDISKTGEKAGGDLCGKSSYASVTTKKAGKAVVPVSAAAKSCAAVWTYLSQQSGFNPANPKAPNNSLKTYATNPLWGVVDGPWKLAAFDPSGQATFKPNPSYSGPVKPKLSEFVELPFTSDTAEFNALVGGKISFGYLPSSDITDPGKSPTVPGANNPRLGGKFTLEPWYAWGINYFPYNFNSVGDGGQAGKIFRQLYFRQAMQDLVDQPLYIEKLFKNYAVPTYGPVPVLPKNSFSTSFEQKNPYSYDPKKAVDLLTAHGWKVDPKGVTTCTDAAKCGVPAGTPLNFTLQYVGGDATLTELMQAQQASWQAAGIKMTLTTGSFDTVIGTAIPCSGKSCTWELENWGGGWVFSPDYYPSGELLFQTGAGSNSGSYSDKKADELIKATNFGDSTLAQYENYLTTNLPVVWQPNLRYSLTEVDTTLHGVFPQNPLLTINPENWYFSK
jgi:peptide/nickel transport system substrate-binding protein